MRDRKLLDLQNLRTGLVAAAIVAVVFMPMLAACDPAPSVKIVSSSNTARAAVRIEIANRPDTRELGLMYRKHLDKDTGMLFIFPSPAPVQFWMKNTEIPLDMIFADSSGRVVGIVANAEPYSERNVGGFDATEYVLEVNGGYASHHGIVVGDHMEFSGFSPHAAE